MGYIGNKNSVALYDSYTKAQSDGSFAPITRSRKNLLINGGFDIWQRGDLFSGINNIYTADRWRVTSGNANTDVRRQDVPVGFTLGGKTFKYYLRRKQFYNGTSLGNVFQYVEDVRTGAGKTLTARAYIRTSVDIEVEPVIYQAFGTGGTPSSAVKISGVKRIVNSTTDFNELIVSFELPSITGKTIGTDGNDGIQLGFEHESIPCDFDIAQVQLEEGDTATDFEYRPIGEELALCQRYYWEFSGTAMVPLTLIRTSDLIRQAYVFYPVTMRAAPSVTAVDDDALALDLANITNVGIRLSHSTGTSSSTVFLSTLTADAEL